MARYAITLIGCLIASAVHAGGYGHGYSSCSSGTCYHAPYQTVVATPTNVTNIGYLFQSPAPWAQQYPTTDAGYTAAVAEQMNYSLQGVSDQVKQLALRSQARQGVYGQAGGACNVNVNIAPCPQPNPWPTPPPNNPPQPNQPPAPQPEPEPQPAVDPQPEPTGPQPVPPNTGGPMQATNQTAFDTCLKCHGDGGKAQGKFDLGENHALSCEDLKTAKEALRDGRMPKRPNGVKQPLQGEDLAIVYAELVARLGDSK